MITQLDTQAVWNALVGTDGWQRIIHDFRCTGNGRKYCGMSGSWFAKIDQEEPDIEQYRCPNCGAVHTFKVPYGANR